MLVDGTGLVLALLDDAVGEEVEVERRNVVGEAPGGARRGSPTPSQLLVQDLQVSGVDGVLHGLEPVAVYDRLHFQPTPPILSYPDVVLRDGRRREGAQVRPVH